MKFATKIFLASFVFSAAIATLLTIFTYRTMSGAIHDGFNRHYAALANTVGDTLEQLDKTTEEAMKSSLEALRQYVIHTGTVPTQSELKRLASVLGVSSIDVIASNGLFLSSTDTPINPSFNLFSLCDKYRDLFFSKKMYERTPLQPSALHGRVTKYSLIPILNHQYVLNVGFEVKFLGNTLVSALKADKNIESLGLYTPSGRSLGHFFRDGSHVAGGSLEPIPSGSNSVTYMNDRMAIRRHVESPVKDCCECRVKRLTIGDSGQFYYSLQMIVSLNDFNATIAELKLNLALIFLVALGLCALGSKLVARRLVAKIEHVNNKTQMIMDSKDLGVRIHMAGSDEIAAMAAKFDQMFEIIEMSQKEIILREKDKTIAAIASQVAHDIRSPIAALDMVMKDVSALPEDKRVLVRNATNRVKDIANLLLQKNREILMSSKPANSIADSNPTSDLPQLVSSLIETIVTEKRMQFRDKTDIDLNMHLCEKSYGLFANIDPIEFRRLISNLCNNAFEALGSPGRVEIFLDTPKDTEVEVSIKDSGSGIPPEILSRLGERGATFGKEGGSGLGIFHARSKVESWGGRLDIHSTVGFGTTVKILLPKAPSPSWFVTKLLFEKMTTVFVLDDDNSIKEVWRQRFIQAGFLNHEIEPIFVSTPDELRAAYVNCPKHTAKVFLIDFEIIGSEINGLDIAEELKIGRDSILISSRWEEPSVRQRCLELGVQLIPKALAAFVPISIVHPLAWFDAVLLDDDDLIITTWKSVANQHGKSFAGFYEPDSFFAALVGIDRNTAVFVDSNLKGGVKGEDLVSKIYNLGFKKIYLATGYEPETFSHVKGLLAVVGKKPPWIIGGRGEMEQL